MARLAGFTLIIVGFCIILVFLSGCVDEKEKTELISLCYTKTNITYSDSPDCLTAQKCNEKYNSNFKVDLKSNSLKTVAAAKLNYDASVVDSWVSISKLLDTTKKINASCSDVTSDKFTSLLQDLYSYSKICSADLASLGYRQTVLLGSIKTTLEKQDINLLADTKAYQYYKELVDNWNITMGDIVITNKKFNLQKTLYNSWTFFNNRFLYAPNQIPPESVLEYKNIIKYGLLQEEALNLFGHAAIFATRVGIPHDTLLTTFAGVLFDAINKESISYGELNKIFSEYFNLSEFVKEYTSLFGYKGVIISTLTQNLKELDSELWDLENKIEQKRQMLISKLESLETTKTVTPELEYVSSFFSLDLPSIEYTDKITSLKLTLSNFNGTLGEKYVLTNSAEKELAKIEQALKNYEINKEKLLFACKTKINSAYAENKEVKFYYDKFKKEESIENCYLFLKNLDTVEKQTCEAMLDKLEKELNININKDKPCDELMEISNNITNYLGPDIINTIFDIKNYFRKINIIKFKNPECLGNQYNELHNFVKNINTNNALTNTISELGLTDTVNAINSMQKKEHELYSNSLQCYLEKNYSFTKDKLIFSVGFNDDTPIKITLPIAKKVKDISGQCLTNATCSEKNCELSFSCLKKTLVLNTTLLTTKYIDQEINYGKTLEIVQQFCFEAPVHAPEFEKTFVADKIDIYDSLGKQLNYKIVKNNLQLTGYYAEKGSCVFIKYYFTNAVTKKINLESSEKIDDYTTRVKYVLTVTNNLAVMQKNVTIALDFYPDNSQEISIFDSEGREYKPIIGNKNIYFVTDLKPLSENKFSILFYTKDNRKNFISTISKLKDDCEELMNSKSKKISESAKEIAAQLDNISTYTPENNKSALAKLAELRNKITALHSENVKYNIKLDEKNLYLQRLRNAKKFLEYLYSNKDNIKSELIKKDYFHELKKDLTDIDSEIRKLTSSEDPNITNKKENITKKYVTNLEEYIDNLKKEYLKSKEYSKILLSEFETLDSDFDKLYDDLYFGDYNSFFSELDNFLYKNSKNEENISKKIAEQKQKIFSKFNNIERIKSDITNKWDKYNNLVSMFSSKDFEIAKKYEKIPFTLTEVKNNKKLLDIVAKEILNVDSQKSEFENELAKDEKKAVINFDDKKISKVEYNYELASKNLDNIENKLKVLAADNIALAEAKKGNKEYLYDAKSDFENGNYFRAIINAKKAMMGASNTNSNTAVYGLSILILAIIVYAGYFVFKNKKRKKKITYYTVPK